METYDGAWVDAQVAQTIDDWNDCAAKLAGRVRHYRSDEQETHERTYDEELCAVENSLQRTSEANPERSELQERIVASFARFSARALGLEEETIEMLTREFLPVGTELALWARQHDPSLEMSGIIQAARNAWTACGLQPLLGVRIKLTPSILGYSLLYPHSDNYLDDAKIPAETKLQFSRRFRCRLAGESLPAGDDREHTLWALIALIEEQYPRAHFPRVFECLLAIHQAQEHSIGQLHSEHSRNDDFLRLSFAKGGASVLADACLARGSLNPEEGRFAFQWGVLLQLGDDLQDLNEDIRRGSTTLFSEAVATGAPLDGLTIQLLNFAEKVGGLMEELPHGTASLKKLLKTSWRSLIIRAIADSHEFFSTNFLQEAERCSPFRFGFLRARKDRLASRQGLYETLFNVLLEGREDHNDGLLDPSLRASESAALGRSWSARATIAN